MHRAEVQISDDIKVLRCRAEVLKQFCRGTANVQQRCSR